MDNTTRIYFDFLNNLFSYLFECALVKTNLKINIKPHVFFLLLIPHFLYSIPATLPYETLCGILYSCIIMLILCWPHVKKVPILVIKSHVYIIIGQFIAQFFHTLFTWDFYEALDNPYYSSCKETICLVHVYIVYTLYMNGKRMKQFQRRHQNLFSITILAISFTLSYLTLFICQTQDLDSPIIPVLFSSLYLLIIICIHIYQRFIDLMTENAQAQILLEQTQMEADYAQQIDSNLEELHTLQTDISHHLQVLDGFAEQTDYASIHNYISNITYNYTDVPLFHTSSNVISALLNTKYQTAHQKGINFDIKWNFPYVHIEDFSIITILGNLIDNAITASEKCENGWISLSLTQVDSYLEIHIKNNHMETIREKNGEFLTSKENDKSLHGLGIKNIRSTVNQLNGQIEIAYTNTEFDVTILVPNY